MSQTTDTKQTATEAVIVGTRSLPEVKETLVPYGQADTKGRARIDALIAEISLEDTNSIIFFGTRAQQQLTQMRDLQDTCTGWQKEWLQVRGRERDERRCTRRSRSHS